MRCCKCGLDKSDESFAWRNKAQGTRARECRECHSVIRRANYQKNKQRDIKNAKQNIDNIRAWYREYKSNLRCERCGNDHPAVLDFHHKDSGAKDKTIAATVGTYRWSINRIKQEIAKCIVLCANCHRIEHWRG